jgi:hypothetical protein
MSLGRPDVGSHRHASAYKPWQITVIRRCNWRASGGIYTAVKQTSDKTKLQTTDRSIWIAFCCFGRKTLLLLLRSSSIRSDGIVVQLTLPRQAHDD